MPCCVAIGCSNSDKKGYLMKHFPRDPIRKKLWMAKIKRDKWTPSQHSCICEVSSNIKNSSQSNIIWFWIVIILLLKANKLYTIHKII